MVTMKYETKRRIECHKQKIGKVAVVCNVKGESSLPICFVDGKVCTGKIVLGMPSCSGSSFGVGFGDKTVYRCPRLK